MGPPSTPPNWLRFNVSHSQGLAVVAVTRHREIGVDVEEVRPLPDAQPIAERCFSGEENRVFLGVPAADRLAAFFNCWTRKEAYLKALGDGLARPLDAFDVTLLTGEPARLLRVKGDEREAARWSLRALYPALGYVGALVVEGHGWELAGGDWPPESKTVALEPRQRSGIRRGSLESGRPGGEQALHRTRERRGAILDLACGPGSARGVALLWAGGTEGRVPRLGPRGLDGHESTEPEAGVGSRHRLVSWA